MGFCSNISSVAPEDPNAPDLARSSSKSKKKGFLRKGSGRLEPPAPAPEPPAEPAPSRDGLHSAPAGDARPTKDAKLELERAALHSAPAVRKNQPNPLPAEPAPKPEALADFILERADGATAEEADAYLSNIIGGKLVKELRAAEWAARVSGVETLQAMLKRADTSRAAEHEALFKAVVTVLARLLQDKVVPVYLPALQLLEALFAPALLAPLAAALPKKACDVLAPQLVTRAGSSNVRAREDSAGVLLRLAQNPHVGGATVGPHALRPLANNKNQHAALGRLELLHSLVSECGLGARCVGADAACDFVLPFCESASDKTREAAMGLLARVHQRAPEATLALVTARRPTLAQALTISANGEGQGGLAASASSNRPKLAPLARTGTGALPLGSERALGGGGARGASPGAARTPPVHEARARARKTAAELGARSPPHAPGGAAAGGSKKRLSHAKGANENGGDNNIEQIRQRTPTPIPGQQRSTPTKAARDDSGRRTSMFDELEEDLMEAILDAEAVH